ncbi:MAG: CsgG/HfaB family protein, partial [candidate division Zixibacteria bacterium]|nr:CsgG/HfaB family protein [candidate division Zixibacteria bacterium]
CGSVAAQQQGTVADKLAAALVHFNDLDYDEGLAVASGLMKRTDLSSQDSVAIYEVMSIITYGMGEKYRDDAIAYLNRISHIGPCVIHLPREMWPSGLRDKWYKISNAAGALTCSDESKPGVKTIAIMEFDNYSIGEYKEKLELIGKGLADWFESDFRKISSLRVVERDKIAFVLKEIELQKSGAVDKSTAVKVGKILGAQYMVFGSVTQLDSKNTRMVVRVVSVETSEIIASVDKEGKPEYPRLEKGLVEEMAGLLDIKLSDDTKSLIREGGTESFDAATFYAKGIDFMDRYEYKKAYEHFKKAYELDTDFVEAKRKMEIYRPYAI